MTIRQMIERRNAIRTEMAALHAGAADGVLAGDAQTRWDALRAEADTLAAQETRQALIDDMDRRAGGDPVFDAEVRTVGILDVIRAQMPGANGRAAGRARELSQEMARRSGRQAEGLFWDTRAAPLERRVTTTALPANGPGGNLIATNLRSDLFIDRLRNATVVRRLGATVLTDLIGNVDIPRRTGSTIAAWVAENSPIPVSDQAFDKVSLRPRHVGALTELSRNMLQQTSPDLELLTQADMALTLAEAVDTAAMFGTGGIQPTGIVNTAGISISLPGTPGATEPDSPAWESVVSMPAAIQTANAPTDSLAFVGNPMTAAALMRAPRSTTLALGFVMENPTVLAGYKWVQTNIVPRDGTARTAPVIFGDWSELLIGVWSELDILVNPYADSVYAKGNVQVRAMATMDVSVRHPASFTTLSFAA